jgi:DNA (cytosine-5)-methyltransferase 1
MYSSLEVCAGGGGQAIGLEQSGFEHILLVENDPGACSTLRANRPNWKVLEANLEDIDFKLLNLGKVDLLAGGVPCPPFSLAGKQLGASDERDLFPVVLRMVDSMRPRALMIENVKGLFGAKFANYRREILDFLENRGYKAEWRLLNAADYGVPQVRFRSILVAMNENDARYFSWPVADKGMAPTVGQALIEEMASNGWMLADDWAALASDLAPTLVGGSKKHGGADLGPTRAKEAWRKLGVDGMGLANTPPESSFIGMPRLTNAMAALIQGFPKDWKFEGKKTSTYRQIGNAFPPPVARAVGNSIRTAMLAADGKLPQQVTQSLFDGLSFDTWQLPVLGPEPVQLGLRSAS